MQLENGLDTIEQGSLNWRLLLNSNFSKLDSGRWIAILEGNLPISHIANRFFYTTDTNKIYYDDGTNYTSVNDFSEFLLLADTPASYLNQAGKTLVVNPGEDALVFEELVKDFLQLSDTPAGYEGNEGKLVSVKTDGTGLEFIASAVNINEFTDLNDTPIDYIDNSEQVVFVKPDESGLDFANVIDLGEITGSSTVGNIIGAKTSVQYTGISNTDLSEKTIFVNGILDNNLNIDIETTMFLSGEIVFSDIDNNGQSASQELKITLYKDTNGILFIKHQTLSVIWADAPMETCNVEFFNDNDILKLKVIGNGSGGVGVVCNFNINYIS